MLGNHGRGLVKQVFTGPAKALARLGVTPNQVTVVGTVLSIAAAVGLLGTGQWIIGPIVLAVILFADSLDGTLARLTGSSSPLGPSSIPLLTGSVMVPCLDPSLLRSPRTTLLPWRELGRS